MKTGLRIFTEIHNPKKRTFLAAFCQSGRIVRACKEAGIHWTSHYHWLKHDKDYPAAFETAKQIAADYLEGEVYRRATMKNKPSDILLMFAMKARKPEYRDNPQLAVQVNNAPPQINFNIIHQLPQSGDKVVEKEREFTTDGNGLVLATLPEKR
jgi:hypothetical protein